MHVHSSYLYRMTALYAIQVLTESLDVDMLSKVSGFVGVFIQGHSRCKEVVCAGSYEACRA